MIIMREVSFRRRSNRTQALIVHPAERPAPLPAGRIPRVTRLMALAIRLDAELRHGVFETQQALADALRITQPRLTQIMNLTHLAPDIQEALLHLPRTERGRDAITERDLRPIAAVIDWHAQRQLWRGVIVRSEK